jgi:hypothetical protein
MRANEKTRKGLYHIPWLEGISGKESTALAVRPETELWIASSDSERDGRRQNLSKGLCGDYVEYDTVLRLRNAILSDALYLFYLSPVKRPTSTGNHGLEACADRRDVATRGDGKLLADLLL